MFLLRYRNTRGSRREQEMLWGYTCKQTGDRLHNFFKFSQAFMSVSIKPLDYGLRFLSCVC